MPPAPANDDAPATKPPARPRQKARRNIGALPKHLPRCEQVIEPDTTACPCCAGRLHKIGEDVSEVLDVIPAILRYCARSVPNMPAAAAPMAWCRRRCCRD
jgi:transposase